MRTIGNKEIAVDSYAGIAQGRHFFQKRQRIKHHAVADHAAAALPQHAARNQLENEFLAVDDDGVAGIVPAGVTGYDRKALRQDVDDLPLALVAPLGTNNHRGFAFFQNTAPYRGLFMHRRPRIPGSRTLLTREDAAQNYWEYERRRCVRAILSRARRQ